MMTEIVRCLRNGRRVTVGLSVKVGLSGWIFCRRGRCPFSIEVHYYHSLLGESILDKVKKPPVDRDRKVLSV